MLESISHAQDGSAWKHMPDTERLCFCIGNSKEVTDS